MAETLDIFVEFDSLEGLIKNVETANTNLCAGGEFGKPVFEAINSEIENMYTESIVEIIGIVEALGRCINAYQTMVTKTMNIAEKAVQELKFADQTISSCVVSPKQSTGGHHD